MTMLHAAATPPAGGMPAKSYKELAIWSLICAVFILPPAGIIMGVIARRNMRAANNFAGGNFALAGIIIGSLYTALAAIVLYASGDLSWPLGDFDRSAWTGQLIMACVPVYFVLQIWFGCAWSGRWRIAALAPLIVFVPVVVYTLLGALHGSNLWPLLLIFVSPVGVAYLLLACAARAIVNRRAAS
jgi:hypothetical protein